MARRVGCVYCGRKDCNNRCRRSDLQREIRRLRDENAALMSGERLMEAELDRLVTEARRPTIPDEALVEVEIM